MSCKVHYLYHKLSRVDDDINGIEVHVDGRTDEKDIKNKTILKQSDFNWVVLWVGYSE